MNTRERFLSVMNFEKVDLTLYWEMGYWKDTVERWYRPHIDHHVHPNVSWEDFRYYRGLLTELILREKIIRKESLITQEVSTGLLSK
jgi:hypothetical protein